MKQFLNDSFKALWAGKDIFREASMLNGKVYRQKEGRTTLQFLLDGKYYFLKYHRGIGWAEIIKNLLQLRLPVLGADNEFDAANVLAEQGIDTLTPVAFASRGFNPAKKESFIITEDLSRCVSLEDYCAKWPEQRPSWAVKQALIKHVATTSRLMHKAGVNHRDFYLCHFLLDETTLLSTNMHCYLIDLHRAQIRQRVPERWKIKDISGLLFSAMDIGLTRADLLRFVEFYGKKPWRVSLEKDRVFWVKVVERAESLYLKEHGRQRSPMRF